MNIVDAWANHREHSRRLSDVTRQATLASVAVIWSFRIGSSALLPRWLAASAFMLVLGLVLDALQYGVLVFSWEKFCTAKEAELNQRFADDAEKQTQVTFGAPDDINAVGAILFWTKLATMLIGELILLGFLFDRFLQKVT